MADTADLVARLRRFGTGLSDIEAKAAVGSLPKSLVETLSAFANSGGGTVILGLDEASGFVPAHDFDPVKIRDALAGACTHQMEPPLRFPIEIVDFDGASLVRADVSELDPIDKPCFVKNRGHYQGSFIRGGDGDRRLTHYEVTQLLSNRTQPTYDAEPVADATLDDLDQDITSTLLARVRARSPRAFAKLSDEHALVRLGAAIEIDGAIHPTLAGMLCLGSYPQQFFPQLFMSFVAIPGTELGVPGPSGERFLDNQSLDGPVPVMLADALGALQRNMNRAAVVRGLLREDRFDYPLEVLRELLVNALMHRDYSPAARGTQIQIELYADRLVVRSPGGLYGANSVDVLGTPEQVSSSRNAVLARLLSDLPTGDAAHVVCENRGSGLPSVVAALRQAGMTPPEFAATPARMQVTVPQHALLSVETIDWISSLGHPDLSDAQHLALAIMRSTGRVTNAMLQAWGVDQPGASLALRDLVSRELATRSRGKRYASYRLAQTPVYMHRARHTPPLSDGIEAELDAITQAILAGHTTARGLQSHLNIGYQTVLRRLRVLVDRGTVQRVGRTHSSRQSYQVTTSRDRQ